MTSSIAHGSGRGSAAPASRRERSNRSSIRRDRRRLSVDHDRGELEPLGLAQLRRRKAPARRRDRRQGRAQVVRHRAQERGLEDVRAPQRARLDRVPEEALALERGRQQRLERRHDPFLQPPQVALGQAGGHEKGADLAASLAQREGEPTLVAGHRPELDGRGWEVERPREPLRRHGQGLAELARAQGRRAISAARSASRHRSPASAARARAAWAR
jgi:hypothetical protein